MSGFKDFSFDDDTELEQPHQTQPLYIELVPRTSWGDNLRTRMKKAEWDRLRKAQARWAGWRCEVCGESGKTQGFDWHVECHEVWDYDDRTQIQRLERLISLCPLCHKVKHYGRTFSVDGPEAARAAMDRLARLNGWSLSQVGVHIEDAFDQWENRSQQTWTLDLSYLDEAGVSILPA